jgi:hypothetical protein
MAQPTGDARKWRQWQIEPRRGSVSITISITTCKTHRTRPWRRRAAQSRGSLFLYFSLSSLSLSHVPQFLPLVYKGKVGHPIGDLFLTTQKHIMTLGGLQLHFTLTRDLGSLSRSFVTPTTNSSASNTNKSSLDVGTFCPN